MARRYLWLSADIERKHRAKLLEDEPGSLEPLITRTPRVNWMIHPAWVQRYVFYLFMCLMSLY